MDVNEAAAIFEKMDAPQAAAPETQTPTPEPQAAPQEPEVKEQPEPQPEGESPKVETPELVEVERRIKSAEREAERQRKQAEYWTKVAQDALKTQAEARTQTAPAQPQDDGLPKFPKSKPELGQFKDYDEFVDAVTDWKLEKRDFDRAAKFHADQARTQQAQVQNFKAQKIEESTHKYPDFFETSDTVGRVITPIMNEALFRSELFADMVNHLGTNLAEARRIATLDPFEQIYELKSLERKLKSDAINLKKKETQSPPVVQKPGSAAPTSTRPDVLKTFTKAKETGDMHDWAKHLEARGV